MKKILTVLFVVTMASIWGDSFEDELKRVETWINTNYQPGTLAHRSANKKLLDIFNSQKTESEKITEMRKIFPKAFPSEEPEKLIVTEPITWEIGSLKLGYDIQEGAATEAKTGDIVKDLSQLEASHGKNKSKNAIEIETGGYGVQGQATAQVGLKGSSAGGTRFDWGIGASGSISGRYEKNSTDRMENSSSWSKKNQRMLQRNREKILSMINQLAIKNPHLTFTVKLYNRTNSNVTFDLVTASIPVYMGKQSCNNPAKPFRVTSQKLVLGPNNPAGQDIVFRMDLDTTSARELVEFMAKDTPRVAFDEGTIEIVNSKGENLRTKRHVLLAKSSPVVLSEPEGKTSWWISQLHASKKNVTIGEACDVISLDVRNIPQLFTKNEKGDLCSVSGVPFGKFQIRDNSGVIAFLEYLGKIHSEVSADLLNKPIEHDGFTIYIVNITTLDKIQNPKLIRAIIEQYGQFQGNVKFKGYLSYQIALYFKENQNDLEYNKYLEESANLGNATACYMRGKLNYDKGDYREAVNWFQRAADHGHADAQNYLGMCYYYGNGVEQNYDEAAMWYKKAADHGHAKAQYSLGMCYYNGTGVGEKNYQKAFEWCIKAANAGNSDAQYSVGFFYHKGEGTDEDIVEAVKWYHQAAKQGDAEAQNNLGDCYDTGLGVKIDHMKAYEWYYKSAELGLAKAQYNLAKCYFNGTGVKRDYNKAFEWFYESAKQEYLDALYAMGLCYYKGQGVKQDYKEAVNWYRKAAERGHADAQYAMGLCYYKGQGVKQDYKEAVNWYRKAAEQNHVYAQYELGRCYFKGLVKAPCTINQIRKPNMNKKHKLSFEGCLDSLPKTFPYGRRYREALVWYRKAADNGHQEAVRILPKVEGEAENEEIWERGKTLGREDWKIWVDQKLKYKP